MWQHGAWGGVAQLEASLSLHNVLCFADRAIHCAQVHQARAEAEAVAEAAAEQRVASALAHERAELDKQVQINPCLAAVRQ